MSEMRTFRLAHDGVHWAGSFQKALGAVCADLLADGPLPVQVTMLDQAARSGEDTYVVAGTLTAVTDEHLVLGGGPVARRDVLEVAF